jgi:exodeoxyribonuclease VII small subunit
MTRAKDATPPGDAALAALTFEQAYGALGEVVAALEQGGQALDDALALYERGVALAARCDALLSAAELRVRRIDGDGGDAGELAL